jgi:NAD(P)-dependent dehydrogenase (short-subunit alcohol dehydrogenase family)
MSELPGLAGAFALVAGVGPGLGAATALELARAGAHIVVAARRSESMDPVVSMLDAEGLPVTAIAADLASDEDRVALVEGIRDQFGRLDVLIYNASTTGVNVEAARADLGQWREMMEVNLWGGLALVQLTLPLMRAADRARVVFISAMTTRLVSSPGRGGYAISKAALNQAVKTLAYELGPEGIRVNAVVPGWMETDTVRTWRDDPALSHHVATAMAQIPLGRIPLPSEVAGSVVFLASHLSGAVTGELIDSNGGQFMRG